LMIRLRERTTRKTATATATIRIRGHNGPKASSSRGKNHLR
jgi:hypothetical protein